MMNDIKVSVICTTYNQEKYIDKAIESFVMQKTNFHYEIIIHDDASTDGTGKIIDTWKQKYPDLIIVIKQDQNVYSKDCKSVWTKYTFPIANGKYIALCEGDDYWIDEYKLQKQYDIMQANSEVSLSVHASRTCDRNGKVLKKNIRAFDKSKIVPARDIILGSASMFHTGSMFFKTADVQTFPKFYYIGTSSDFTLLLLLILKGKTHYLDEFCSVYRINSIGSWSAEIGNDLSKTLKAHLDGVKIMEEYKKEAIPQYYATIDASLAQRNLMCAILLGEKSQINTYLHGRYAPNFNRLLKLKARYYKIYRFIKFQTLLSK